MKKRSTDILDIIFKVNDIREFSLLEFPSNPMLQNRTEKDKLSEAQVKMALKIRKQLTLPFWESVCLTFFSRETYSPALLKSILFHNENLKAKKLDIGKWPDEKKRISTLKANCAVLSEVVTAKGKKMHIPMLDFHCPNNKFNEKLACEVIRNIYTGKGYLLESGDSYHFYGEKLLTKNQLIMFLGKALQYSPIIDKMWLAHQLRELKCALRVSKKHNVFPFLVQSINNY